MVCHHFYRLMMSLSASLMSYLDSMMSFLLSIPSFKVPLDVTITAHDVITSG